MESGISFDNSRTARAQTPFRFVSLRAEKNFYTRNRRTLEVQIFSTPKWIYFLFPEAGSYPQDKGPDMNYWLLESKSEARVDYNPTLCRLQTRLQHMGVGNTMPESTLTLLCQSRLYPPPSHGLRIWPQFAVLG
jgi:hypothetical protein